MSGRVAWAIVLACVATPALAAAQDAASTPGASTIAEAEQLLADGHFERAEAMLRSVDDTAALTRAELETLLLLRATAAHARGDARDVHDDMRLLARLRAGAPLAASVPPPLRRAYAQADASPIALEVEAVRAADGVALRVTSTDEPGLVRGCRVSARWQERTEEVALVAGEAHLAAAPSQAVEIRVELRGLGGALLEVREVRVVAVEEAAPNALDDAPADPPRSTPLLPPVPSTSSGVDAWMVVGVVLGISAAAAIATAIGVAVATSDGGPQGVVVQVRW